MTDREAVLHRLYKAFNDGDVETLVEAMHPDVDWPNFLEGGRVRGRAALRQYWIEQFRMVRPDATPIGMHELPDGRISVRLHYVIQALDGGGVWTDEITNNTFTFEGEKIIRMVWGEPEDSLGAADGLVIGLLDAINASDAAAATALLHPDADWPILDGYGRVQGHDQIEAMWREAFSHTRFEITLLEMKPLRDGRRTARIRVITRDLEGTLQSDAEVTITFNFRDGVVGRIDRTV